MPNMRFLGVLAIGLALATTSCDNGDEVLGVDDGGRVQFVLSSGAQSDGPAATDHNGEHGHRWFESAKVTLSSILARNLDGELIDVDMELPVEVDIMSLENKEVTLPDGVLPPGTYDQLVVVLTHLVAVTHNGGEIAITPPGGGWTSIIPVCPFEVQEGATTVVTLKFMHHRAFAWHNNRFQFFPDFVCEGS